MFLIIIFVIFLGKNQKRNLFEVFTAYRHGNFVMKIVS